MERIKNITAATCDQLRPDLEAALNVINRKYGLNINVGNMRYAADGSSLDVKIGMNVIYSNAKTKEEIDFIKYCVMYGFQKEDLGAQFGFEGKRYEICGLKPGKRIKYQILAKIVGTNDVYRFRAIDVKNWING